MTTGRITSEGEAALPLTVRRPGRGRQGPSVRLEAVIDTGFDGALTLPLAQIETLRLPHVGSDQVQLGDGSLVDVQLFRAVIVFEKRRRGLLVERAPTVPLMGTSLLWEYRLRVDFEPGGRVQVEALP